MLQHIPGDVTNIILDYYSQLRDLKWVPFIDSKTGKLLWKVNKYSIKYEYMNKLLKNKTENHIGMIDIDIFIRSNNPLINQYSTIGSVIPLKTEYYVNKWNVIKRTTILYFEFIDDDNCVNYTFCRVLGNSSLCDMDFYVYVGGRLFGSLEFIHMPEFKVYGLYIDKI